MKRYTPPKSDAGPRLMGREPWIQRGDYVGFSRPPILDYGLVDRGPILTSFTTTAQINSSVKALHTTVL